MIPNTESTDLAELSIFEMKILLSYIIDEKKTIEINTLNDELLTLQVKRNIHNDEAVSYIISLSNDTEIVDINIVTIADGELPILTILSELIFIIINGVCCNTFNDISLATTTDIRLPTTLSNAEISLLISQVNQAFYKLSREHLYLKDLNLEPMSDGFDCTYFIMGVDDEQHTEIKQRLGIND